MTGDDRARLLHELEARFPGVQPWYGEYTRGWYAWDRVGPLLAGRTPAELARAIEAARSRRPDIYGRPWSTPARADAG
ncbi:MAG: hypothetical protein IRZ05_18450 [Micromonosporaceae bacterium]|nr:hypothetical protein [Micromonosporaceae bacterium]